MKSKLLTLASLLTILLASSGIRAQANDYPGVWTTITKANSGMLGDTVLAITFDNKDSLWVGTWQGVEERIPGGWTLYNNLQYMPRNDIADLDFANNSLWIGHHAGITRFNGSGWVTYTVDNSELVNAPVLHLAHDNRGDLWYATARGLGRLSSNDQWYSYKRLTVPSMPYDGIEAITTDPSSKNVWMSFIGTAGLVKFPDGSSTAAKYLKQDSIPGFPKGAVYVKSLAVDWSGNLWAGTARHGVVRINDAGATIFSRQTTSVIGNDTINTITVDGCGNVWIGTEGGAFMYDGATWYDFTATNGKLPNNFVHAIEVDRFGHVWIGTKGGLAEFRPLPKVPELLAPPMAAVIDTNSVVCRWNWSCPSILKYWYEIADNPQFTNSRIDTTSPSLMGSMSAIDTGLMSGRTYYWRVKALNDAGWSEFSNTWTFTVQVAAIQMTEDAGYRLLASYPNPTTDNATISFELPSYGLIAVTLHDALGRSYATGIEGMMGPGSFSAPIDLGNLPSGVYIYTLTAGKVMLERTLQIIR